MSIPSSIPSEPTSVQSQQTQQTEPKHAVEIEFAHFMEYWNSADGYKPLEQIISRYKNLKIGLDRNNKAYEVSMIAVAAMPRNKREAAEKELHKNQSQNKETFEVNLCEIENMEENAFTKIAEISTEIDKMVSSRNSLLSYLSTSSGQNKKTIDIIEEQLKQLERFNTDAIEAPSKIQALREQIEKHTLQKTKDQLKPLYWHPGMQFAYRGKRYGTEYLGTGLGSVANALGGASNFFNYFGVKAPPQNDGKKASSIASSGSNQQSSQNTAAPYPSNSLSISPKINLSTSCSNVSSSVQETIVTPAFNKFYVQNSISSSGGAQTNFNTKNSADELQASETPTLQQHTPPTHSSNAETSLNTEWINASSAPNSIPSNISSALSTTATESPRNILTISPPSKNSSPLVDETLSDSEPEDRLPAINSIPRSTPFLLSNIASESPKASVIFSPSITTSSPPVQEKMISDLESTEIPAISSSVPGAPSSILSSIAAKSPEAVLIVPLTSQNTPPPMEVGLSSFKSSDNHPENNEEAETVKISSTKTRRQRRQNKKK